MIASSSSPSAGCRRKSHQQLAAGHLDDRIRPRRVSNRPSITFDCQPTSRSSAARRRSRFVPITAARASSARRRQALKMRRSRSAHLANRNSLPASRPCCVSTLLSARAVTASIDAMKNIVNVALNRPSRASSEVAEHPARLANDGDRGSAWISDNPNAAWTVDLEGFYELSSLRLILEAEGNFRFFVEFSTDSTSWITAIDRSATENAKMERNDVFPPGAVTRYVRIRFVHIPPGSRGLVRSRTQRHSVCPVKS